MDTPNTFFPVLSLYTWYTSSTFSTGSSWQGHLLFTTHKSNRPFRSALKTTNTLFHHTSTNQFWNWHMKWPIFSSDSLYGFKWSVESMLEEHFNRNGWSQKSETSQPVNSWWSISSWIFVIWIQLYHRYCEYLILLAMDSTILLCLSQYSLYRGNRWTSG